MEIVHNENISITITGRKNVKETVSICFFIEPS